MNDSERTQWRQAKYDQLMRSSEDSTMRYHLDEVMDSITRRKGQEYADEFLKRWVSRENDAIDEAYSTLGRFRHQPTDNPE